MEGLQKLCLEYYTEAFLTLNKKKECTHEDPVETDTYFIGN